MKRNTSCKLVELLHPPYNAPRWQLLNYFFSLSQKRVNQYHCVIDLTSHLALDPCAIKLSREPKWLHFDVL